MASPQIEKGYTKIANELLDSMIRLVAKGATYRAILWIARQTYGWSRKETDKLTAWRFHKDAGIQYTHAKKALRELRSANIATNVGLNKDYERWGTPGPDTSRGPHTSRDQIRPYTGTRYVPIPGPDTSRSGGSYKVLKKGKKVKETAHSADAGEKGRKPNSEWMTLFDSAYDIYGLKIKRVDSEKAWKKIKGDNKLFDIIVLAIRKQKEAGILKGDRYTPAFSSWLNGKRWQDELPETNGIKPASDYSKRFDNVFYSGLIEKNHDTKQWFYKKTGELFK